MLLNYISLVLGVIILIIHLLNKDFFINFYKKNINKDEINSVYKNYKFLPFVAAILLIIKGLSGLVGN